MTPTKSNTDVRLACLYILHISDITPINNCQKNQVQHDLEVNTKENKISVAGVSPSQNNNLINGRTLKLQ